MIKIAKKDKMVHFLQIVLNILNSLPIFQFLITIFNDYLQNPKLIWIFIFPFSKTKTDLFRLALVAADRGPILQAHELQGV